MLDDLGEMRRRRVDGSGSRNLGRVDVLALLSDVLEAAQPAGARLDVRLSGWWDGPGVVVWGDRLRLAQALGNLLANAIEHGGGAVAGPRGAASWAWSASRSMTTAPGCREASPGWRRVLEPAADRAGVGWRLPLASPRRTAGPSRRRRWGTVGE